MFSKSTIKEIYLKTACLMLLSSAVLLQAPATGVTYGSCPPNCISCYDSNSCTTCSGSLYVYDDLSSYSASSFCCRDSNTNCDSCDRNTGDCIACANNVEIDPQTGKCKNNISGVVAIVVGVVFLLICALICFCICCGSKLGGKGNTRVHTGGRSHARSSKHHRPHARVTPIHHPPPRINPRPMPRNNGPPMGMNGGPPMGMNGGPPMGMNGGPPMGMNGGYNNYPQQGMRPAPMQMHHGGPPMGMN